MKTIVIAEIGINGLGDLELTKKLIEKAKVNGCQYVKFQKRDLESTYTQSELDAPRESPFGKTNRDLKTKLEYSFEQYKDIDRYCKEIGIEWFCSAWDIKSIYFCQQFNPPFIKVASALLTNEKFLYVINMTNLPVILSTGMSTEAEIDKAVSVLKNLKYILACTSTYPTKDEEVNLNYIQTLKLQYPQFKIGFSNHSSGLMACHGAAALGAECIEFHITKDRAMYGSDQAASVENVAELMSGIRKMEILLGDGIKRVYESELPIIKKLRKA